LVFWRRAIKQGCGGRLLVAPFIGVRLPSK